MKKLFLITALVAIVYSVTAQGPGNVSSGLRLWLDADALSLNNNDPVPSWTDQSGNSNHATQDTTDFQPTFKTNVINGKPVVQFSTNDYLGFDGSIIANTDYTIFAVVKRTSSGASGSTSGHHYFLGGSNATMNNNLHVGWSGNNTFTHRQYTNDYNMRVPTYNANDPASLYTLRHSSSLGKHTYINGGLRGLNMNAASTGRLANLQSWTGASIGRYLAGTINTRFNGWVAELIIYNRYLSETERKAVEAYIKNKYNLDIAVDLNGPLHEAGILNPHLSVNASKLTESKALGGLTLTGDYISSSSSIYSGHNNLDGINNSYNPDSGLYPDFKRLNRQWFMDFRGTLNTSFSFNLTDLGLDHISPAGNKYALLYRPCTCQNYTIVSSDASIAGKVITFEDISRTETSNNGFYTLGTLDNTESTLPVELTSFNAIVTGSLARITWTTASESNMLGYYIYRNTVDDFSTALLISELIPSTNSSSMQVYTYTDHEVQPGFTYFYWLTAVEYNAFSYLHGPVMVSFNSSDPIPGVPLKTGLKSMYPNPFNPVLNIEYALEKDSDVSVTIYNLKGQSVQNWRVARQDKGTYKLVWESEHQPSGVYLVRFTAGVTREYRKITLSK